MSSFRPRDLSVIIPLFNEQGNVERLLSELSEVLSSFPIAVAVILVDDGSTDGTVESALKARSQFATSRLHIEVVSHETNMGHQTALLTGIRRADSRVVITMDGDLQHPPAVVRELWDAYSNGDSSVVYAIGERDYRDTLLKRTTTFLFPLLLRLYGIRILTGSNDFRLAERRIVDLAYDRYTDLIPLRVSIPQVCSAYAVVRFPIPKRHTGATKFDVRRMFSLFLDSVSVASVIRLAFFIATGLTTAGWVIAMNAKGNSSGILLASSLGVTVIAFLWTLLNLRILRGVVRRWASEPPST